MINQTRIQNSQFYDKMLWMARFDDLLWRRGKSRWLQIARSYHFTTWALPLHRTQNLKRNWCGKWTRGMKTSFRVKYGFIITLKIKYTAIVSSRCSCDFKRSESQHFETPQTLAYIGIIAEWKGNNSWIKWKTRIGSSDITNSWCVVLSKIKEKMVWEKELTVEGEGNRQGVADRGLVIIPRRHLDQLKCLNLCRIGILFDKIWKT